MATNNAVALFWQDFVIKKKLKPETPYQWWAFGDSPAMADELLGLVIEGKKTATTSAQVAYLEEPLPEVGSYSICLDGKGQPQCMLQTTAVKVVPFHKITESDAYKEGEGDRSLASWRQVHQAFWERELSSSSLVFSEELLVVFEEFKVVDA